MVREMKKITNITSPFLHDNLEENKMIPLRGKEPLLSHPFR
jgi:hypothetical protein